MSKFDEMIDNMYLKMDTLNCILQNDRLNVIIQRISLVIFAILFGLNIMRAEIPWIIIFVPLILTFSIRLFCYIISVILYTIANEINWYIKVFSIFKKKN